jgi:hypothetical protein
LKAIFRGVDFDPSALHKEGDFLTKEMVEYINGQRNVVKTEVVMGRERFQNSELVYIGLEDTINPMYVFFNSPRIKNKHKRKIRKTEDGYVIEQCLPKGTGGKPAYVMMMLDEILKADLSLDAYGLLMYLVMHMEWNTGRIIRQRDKKAMTREMMVKEFRVSCKRLKGMLREVRDKGVLHYDTKTRSYYLDKKYFKKGI